MPGVSRNQPQGKSQETALESEIEDAAATSRNCLGSFSVRKPGFESP
jgi:hypothetical protein